MKIFRKVALSLIAVSAAKALAETAMSDKATFLKIFSRDIGYVFVAKANLTL